MGGWPLELGVEVLELGDAGDEVGGGGDLGGRLGGPPRRGTRSRGRPWGGAQKGVADGGKWIPGVVAFESNPQLGHRNTQTRCGLDVPGYLYLNRRGGWCGGSAVQAGTRNGKSGARGSNRIRRAAGVAPRPLRRGLPAPGGVRALSEGRHLRQVATRVVVRAFEGPLGISGTWENGALGG